MPRTICVNRVKKEDINGQRTAGKKAPDDIAWIVENKIEEGLVFSFEELGNQAIPIKPIAAWINNINNWNKLFTYLQNGDYVILQHPYQGIFRCTSRIKKCRRKSVKIIILIHDLIMLRNNIEAKTSKLTRLMLDREEKKLLQVADCIIAHNEAMKEYLINIGIDKDKILILGCFDYITESKIVDGLSNRYNITIAGNLDSNKAGYLRELKTIKGKIHFNLYGPNLSFGIESNTVHWKGLYPPSELPEVIGGGFGLVWDGDSIDTCDGIAGEYSRYNNPHKLSLYLASGMPVIVWSQSGVAEFVISKGIGITVDRLDDIENRLYSIDDYELESMIECVYQEMANIRNANYTVNAIMNAKRYLDTRCDN